MTIYKFKEEEVFVNSLTLYPKYEFTMYSGTVYINNQQAERAHSASLTIISSIKNKFFTAKHKIQVPKTAN